jgi:DNA modification methylase
MGKEKDGIENDNLYREKLDRFQMQWWRACRPCIADNGSAYIWGTAEDLWRLWYGGGLKDSERLTFRNEIVWDKMSGQGVGSDTNRMYPTASERCLFFVIGEQGWNNNADNYWEGFEPIRAYLEQERKKVGWTPADVKRITGVGMFSHWFTKSQFVFITEQHYKKLQAAAQGDAFRREYDDLRREYDDLRREYDDLRREWYATRAPFDNTHALMTDVWQFRTLAGDERPDHPTPKPVELVERIVKTSGTNEGLTLDPFLGSGTTLMACENLGRKCRAIEISPGYVAVALERWAQATGQTPVRV